MQLCARGLRAGLPSRHQRAACRVAPASRRVAARAVEEKPAGTVMRSGEETDQGEALAGDYCSLDAAGQRVRGKRRWALGPAVGTQIGPICRCPRPPLARPLEADRVVLPDAQ